MENGYIKRASSTIPFGYEIDLESRYLKPIPEQIDVIKDFGDGEKWLASKKRTDSEIRKYAKVVRSRRREAETIGGCHCGDNDAKRLWSNL